MRLLLVCVCVFLLGLSPALAGQCFSDKEAEAEQGIRIHSELMVIGLNCQHNSTANGKNLYMAYRDFTSAHEKLFVAYEKILLKSFKDSGEKNPEAALNTLRTNFANKISNDAARMRPDMFCQRYAPRIEKASVMKYEDVRKWAATIFESHPVSKPLCASAKQGG
ncbi:MAG TPA: hypothetical protein DEA55_10730 [Rhodospirillaceae bacterium]|nr:hypothetical protein [Rhodospirillaceae bacterium]